MTFRRSRTILSLQNFLTRNIKKKQFWRPFGRSISTEKANRKHIKFTNAFSKPKTFEKVKGIPVMIPPPPKKNSLTVPKENEKIDYQKNSLLQQDQKNNKPSKPQKNGKIFPVGRIMPKTLKRPSMLAKRFVSAKIELLHLFLRKV